MKLFPLSELVDRVIDIKADLKNKTETELHRWKTPRHRAVKVFTSMIGDIDVKDLSRKHALLFFRYIQKRLENGEIKIGTANKK